MTTAARKRLIRDFKKLQEDPPAGISGAPTEDNIMVWEAIIFGPVDTPFEDGTFKLSLEFTEEYPNRPPTVKFISKMFHPNVYADGSICLDILQNRWAPTYDVAGVLTSIQSLLDEPNPNSPANSVAAQLYQENRREYEKKVQNIVELSWMAFNDDEAGEKNASTGSEPAATSAPPSSSAPPATTTTTTTSEPVIAEEEELMEVTMSLMKNLKPLTKLAPRPVITWDKHERIVRNQEIWANPNSIVHRLPFHYQQRYWRNVLADAQPVHYEPPTQGLMWDTKRLIEVEMEDYPVRPLPNVPEMHNGLWGGEGVVKGYRESAPFVKKKILPRRWYPRWWFPEYYETVLHSEVLDQYFKITVTYRSQRLIDEAYGLDFYLLKTPEIDVNSKLGNRLKRAILIKLAQGTYYPDDEQKRRYIEQKYAQFVLPLEEAEWVGLELNEACRKLQDIEDNTAPQPEKYRYEEELLTRLQSGEDTLDQIEEDLKPKYQKSAFAEKSTLGRMMQPIEQTMVKNFRVEFIERVCYFDPTAAVRLSSEVGRVLLEEKLSRGGDIDLPKLKSYAMRFVVPQRYRVRIWKLLIKIATCYPTISLSVSTNRFQEADRLWQTVRRMLSFQLDRYLPSIPNPQLIALTILFARTEVSILDLQQTLLCSPSEKALLMMTQQIHDLCKHTTAPVNWEDTFWLSCQIRDRLTLHETIISSLVEEGLYIKQTLQDRLNQNNQSKRISESHGEAVSFDMNSLPESMSSSDFELSFPQNGTSITCFDTVTALHLEMWYRSGGSSWLQDEPLFMLWDKICSQEMAILYLKSVLFQLFTTIAMSSETHKRLPADDLINQALSTSMQMQVIKMGMDDVGRRSTAILNDVAFSMTY